jgi:hypothetical protein
MNSAAPSKRVVMSAGVVPTIVALVVAAIMIIERLQVDWTASCALVANVPQSCGLQFYEQFFSILLPSFAFAVAHILSALLLRSRDNRCPGSAVGYWDAT